MAGPTDRPTAEPTDLFVHGPGQRHRLTQGLKDVLRGQLMPCIEGVIEGAYDGLFDFRAAKIFATSDQGIEVEWLWVAATLAQVNAEYLLVFFFILQVYEKNSIKPLISQHYLPQ